MRRRRTFSDWVRTTMPSATGVVQEAGRPRRPSISTTQRRQEPKASMLSVAQSFGTAMPASADARITLVPSGTVTSKPSMVRVTLVSARDGGVPRSRSSMGSTKSFTRRPPCGWR